MPHDDGRRKLVHIFTAWCVTATVPTLSGKCSCAVIQRDEVVGDRKGVESTAAEFACVLVIGAVLCVVLAASEASSPPSMQPTIQFTKSEDG